MTAAPDRREDAVGVVRALRDAGHIAYFAGGCVRDELLGLAPKDYDVATDAVPEVVREVFGHRRTRPVGAAFGVVLVRAGRSNIEVATFRTDLDYHDGRRPSGVVFTNAEEDAKRRDFTINGLFRDPLVKDPAHDDGVIDYVYGKHDLRDRILRCIGRPVDRFGEDYLRMLRAVRFAARFDLEIEQVTWEAMEELSPRLQHIAPERIADELRRMLVAPTRGRAWKLLWESGLLAVVLRTLAERIAEPPARTPIFDHVAAIPDEIPFGLALAATALEARHAAGVPLRVQLEPAEVAATRHALKRSLRISNEEGDAFAGAMNLWPLLQDAPPTVALMKRFLASPHSPAARELLASLAFYSNFRPRVEWLGAKLADLAREEVAPAPLMTGEDLIALGLKPGPVFKQVLDDVYDAQLEGRITTRTAALDMARTMADSHQSA